MIVSNTTPLINFCCIRRLDILEQLILLDELTGRNIARFNKLNFVGSIGCLIKAKQNGIISEIKTSIDAMRKDARFWINEKLYQKVLQDNREI